MSRTALGRPSSPWPVTPLPEAGPSEAPPPGLPRHDLRLIAWPVEEALAHQGKRARSRKGTDCRVPPSRSSNQHDWPPFVSADRGCRAEGDRDPTGATPEQWNATSLRTVRATRNHRRSDQRGTLGRRAGKYHPECGGSRLPRSLRNLRGHCRVDYKGSHRPAINEDHWHLGEWQVQTFGWLRQRQQLFHPVAAGILIYINELAPGGDDIRKLRTAIENGKTDVA